MRLLIDANPPRSAVGLPADLGHFVDFARDIGLASAPDEAIARRAHESAAALITRDLDFSDVRRYPPGDYSGLIVLRLPDDAVAAEIVGVTAMFVRERRYLNALPGRLAIVEPDRVRFRAADSAEMKSITPTILLLGAQKS